MRFFRTRKRTKVALLNPPFLFPVKDEFVFSHCLGPRYLSSYLKSRGHRVTFIDALVEGFANVTPYANGFLVGLESDEIAARVPADADLVGISVPFSQLAPIAHDLVDLIKKRLPRTPVIMGGVYPSTQPDLALTSRADMIVVGEGEQAISEIAESKRPQEVQGVYTTPPSEREGYTPARLIENLDDIPFPDYSLDNIDRYFDLSPRMAKDTRTASIITSRGCPFSCEFCSIHPVYGRKWRFRSARNVLDEIGYLTRRFGVRCVEFEDDNLTLDIDRTVEILEGFIRLNEQGYRLMWRTPNGVRIDTLDDTVIALIKRSNCAHIVLGLEHGDGEMLRIMDKRLDLDRAYHVIESLVRHQIPSITLFVITGYPGETKERFENGMQYLEKVKALGGNISVCVNIAQPYPGTRLLARCREEGYITDKQYDNFLMRRDLMSTGHSVPVTTPDFDTAEVVRRKRRVIDCFGCC